MTPEELVTTVETAIGRLARDYAASARDHDLYEASLLAIAVDAARRTGGQTRFTNDGATSPPEIRFRTAPGNLWARGYTYAIADYPSAGKALEIHLGVMVAGRSRVAHECDIAVIDGEEALRSRRNAVHPRNQGLIAAIEAKHYCVSPGIGIGRAFIGLASELVHKRCTLAFPAVSSQNLAALLARKDCECSDQLIPGTPAADRLRSRLEQMICNWRDQR